MKIKNAILGIVSLLFAAGSAFASLSAVTPDYINVLYQGDANFTCTLADTCPGGIKACAVSVVVPGFPAFLVPKVYDNLTNPTLCAIQLMTNAPTPPTIQKSRRIITFK